MGGGLVEVVSCMFLDAALRGEVRASELHSSMTKRFRKGYPNSLHIQLSGLPLSYFLKIVMAVREAFRQRICQPPLVVH